MRGFAIGEMSKWSGVNIETIRYYERIGIMPNPVRTQGGNRQYNSDQLKRLSFIKKCRDLGFGIDEIRTLLRMVDRRDFTCGEVHQLTTSHLASIRSKMSDLKRMESVLKQMSSECSQGNVPDCPIIDALTKFPKG